MLSVSQQYRRCGEGIDKKERSKIKSQLQSGPGKGNTMWDIGFYTPTYISHESHKNVNVCLNNLTSPVGLTNLFNFPYVLQDTASQKSAILHNYSSIIVTKLDLPRTVGPLPKPTHKRVDIVKIPNPPLGHSLQSPSISNDLGTRLVVGTEYSSTTSKASYSQVIHVKGTEIKAYYPPSTYKVGLSLSSACYTQFY